MSRTTTGRITLYLVLGIESVFFVMMLVSYAALRDQVSWSLPHTLTRLIIPLVNTVVLLISALTAWQSTRAVRTNKQIALRNGLMITLLLGLIFVIGQVYEFSHAGFRIDDQAFGGVFFTLMVFHAVHLLAGVVFLALNYVRARLGDFSSNRYEAVELGNLFWYYVTAVWLLLFVVLYLV